VRHTFVRLGSACFLTSLTTAVGFASLAVARIGTVRSFGIYAGIGILYAFVANLLVIPVGLYVTGSRLGVPVGGGAQARPDASRLRAGLMRLGEFVCRRPRLTLGGSLLAILAVSSGLGLVRIESRMF